MDLSDKFARGQTMFFRFFADAFFAKRYGHRAVVLETVAGVPGMVAGMWIHLKSLRQMKTGYGPIIRELLAEAENERRKMEYENLSGTISRMVRELNGKLSVIAFEEHDRWADKWNRLAYPLEEGEEQPAAEFPSG